MIHLPLPSKSWIASTNILQNAFSGKSMRTCTLQRIQHQQIRQLVECRQIRRDVQRRLQVACRARLPAAVSIGRHRRCSDQWHWQANCEEHPAAVTWRHGRRSHASWAGDCHRWLRSGPGYSAKHTAQSHENPPHTARTTPILRI